MMQRTQERPTPSTGRRPRRRPSAGSTPSRPSARGRAAPAALGVRLDRPTGGTIQPDEGLWGFGGLHGGLALAELVAAMGTAVGGDATVRSVTGQFLRPLRDAAPVRTQVLRRGGSVTSASASAEPVGGTALVAAATFGTGRATVEAAAPVAPPLAPPPEALDPLDLGAIAPPFVRHLEIRPVGEALPFAGGDRPELTAWVRLRGEDGAPDDRRLVLLADALAPSYAATLTTPAMLPTVELTVRPTPGPVGDADGSPWVLLHARTTAVSADGWVTERIDLWDVEGRHRASADQLRLLLAW